MTFQYLFSSLEKLASVYNGRPGQSFTQVLEHLRDSLDREDETTFVLDFIPSTIEITATKPTEPCLFCVC